MLMNIAQDGDEVITNNFVRMASFFKKMKFTSTRIFKRKVEYHVVRYYLKKCPMGNNRCNVI